MINRRDSLRRMCARIGLGLKKMGVFCFVMLVLSTIAPFAYIAVVWVAFIFICFVTLGIALFGKDQFFENAYAVDLGSFATLAYVLAISALVFFIGSILLTSLDTDFKPARGRGGSIVSCILCIGIIIAFHFFQ